MNDHFFLHTLGIIAKLESLEPNWFKYKEYGHPPLEGGFDPDCGGEFPDPSQWYRDGYGIGVSPSPAFYMVHAKKELGLQLPNALKAALKKEGQSVKALPVFYSIVGDAIAILRFPQPSPQHLYRNIVRGVSLPGVASPVDLLLGPRAATLILGPMRGFEHFNAPSKWVNPPVLDPRALVEEPRLLKPSAPMLKIDKDIPSRRAKALAHLRSIQARLKPSDDPMKIIKAVAADLVVGFQYDPVEATSLLYMPLGRSKSSRNFRTAVLRLPGPILTLGIDEIGRVMEDAVDEVSPMAVTAWKIHHAQEQVASLIEVMEGLPPKAEQAMMTATDLRRVACDLLGINQEFINPKVFGHLIHKAIQEGRIPLRPGRISHPVYGDQRIYHGVNETFLRECWLWRKNK